MSEKLDKETLDKVREIDGFPIGDDVDIAQKLPEQIIQEDSSLLMYYDNSLSRI